VLPTTDLGLSAKQGLILQVGLRWRVCCTLLSRLRFAFAREVRDIMTWAPFSSFQWRKNNDTGSPVSLGGVEMPSAEILTILSA
jgi:hypothetical protein